TPTAVELGSRMLARCPGLAIQASTTASAVGYPIATFSGACPEWYMRPTEAMWLDHCCACSNRTELEANGGSPWFARCWFIRATTWARTSVCTITGEGEGVGVEAGLGVGIGVGFGVGAGGGAGATG